MTGHQNTLNIAIFTFPEEAPVFRAPEFLAAKINCANVVRKGTDGNRSTVDLVFENEAGQQFVVLITGRLIRNLAAIIGDEG